MISVHPRLALGARVVICGTASVLMNDLSSVYADFQGVGSKVAVDLAVADYAKSAGVPVEVVIADHDK